MFAFEIRDDATNKRICGLVGRCVLFESYDSNFGRSAFSRDRSDPAAYAKHYTP